MTKQIHNQSALGQRLRCRRTEQGLSQAAVAAAVGISSSYYSEIETSKRIPPPPHRMSQIIQAIGFCDTEIDELEQLAAVERGLSHSDVGLSDDIQALIREIRKHANTMNPRFIQGLRTRIREAVT